MEGIQLSENELRCFSELYKMWDLEKTGKIPVYKATELLRSANLPNETLRQIVDLCGVGPLGHFGRGQFYTALRLVAAVQSGIPLRAEVLQTPLDLPLPRFTRTTEFEKWRTRSSGTRPAVAQVTSPDLIQLSDTDRTPTPQRHSMGSSVQSDGEEGSAPLSPAHDSTQGGSPEVSSTASDSPTPTNSMQERNWGAGRWHNLVCEEQRQLLGTEEESSDRRSSEDEEDDGDDVWTISDEQREYYMAQFRTLQPDPSGLVAGNTARNFFEKSRLPVQELRKIWQLSDVTKDGALSLEEFNTAMHLVVLRRNNIDLPDVLPPSLVPSVPPPPVPPPAPPASAATAPAPEESPHSLSPLQGESVSPPRSKEWTKFVDSPTSSVSSPGPKPVNFDFQKSAVEQDPKILHPVALRVTPDSQACNSVPPTQEDGSRIPYDQLDGLPGGGSPKKAIVAGEPTELRAIQRPQPKKPAAPGPGAIPPPPTSSTGPSDEEGSATGVTASSHSGPTSLPVSVAPPSAPPRKDPPPPPPPRPYRTHTRSSSLDLNRLGKPNNSSALLGAPPAVPPRVSPSTTSPKKLIGQRSEGDVIGLVVDKAGFADFAQFGQENSERNGSAAPSVRKHGAFEVYRKPSTGSSTRSTRDSSSPENKAESLPVTRQRHRSDASDPSSQRLRAAVRQLKDRNSRLSRLCQELSQEITEAQEERIALELSLEAMHCLGD